MLKLFSARPLAALAIGALVFAGASASGVSSAEAKGKHGHGHGHHGHHGKHGKHFGKFGGGVILIPVKVKRHCDREWRTVFVPGIGLAKAKVRVCH